MEKKKRTGLMLSLMLSASLLAGCSNSGVSSKSEVQQIESSQVETKNADLEAKELLTNLEGTYQELWPVILSDDYRQLWIDDSAAIVGDDNAEAAFEKMSSMVTGTVTGEEAVEAYKDGNMAYDCSFLQDVKKFKFDGDVISGTDDNGKEVFSHSYHYIGMEETRGLYIYESNDKDSGEFTYFCIAPDTMDTTWHIEFRYGSDLDALRKYDSGEYAYWLAAGISTDCTQKDIENCIQLFCTENLSE